VFLPQARLIGAEKCRLAAEAGLEGAFPLDAQLNLEALPAGEQARRISRANEELMRSCAGLIANLTPFRGVSMDAGTAFEVGFMQALGRPLAGYTNVTADYAERARRILETYTPAVETAALDDFYLDFAGTERLYPDFRGTLLRLQMDVFQQTGLSVSVGAARTKVVAAIASRLERPRGFKLIAPGTEQEFLAPLPVEKLHGIGHVHASMLAERGVTTIAELSRVPRAALEAAFGEVIGGQIWERARGLDGREVMLPSTPKSISRETTIEGGTIDTEFLGSLIEYLCERVGSTLRDYGRQARSIGLRIRYVDHFSAHQTIRLMKPSNDERALHKATTELFQKLFTRRVAVRLIGVSVVNLEQDRRQNELFDQSANRRWYLNRGVDNVRGRFGWNSLFYGKGLQLREHYASKPGGLVLSTPCLSR